MNRIIIDTWVQGDCTLGRLFYGGFKCFTLELPWVDNRKTISCIPAGTYKARKRHSPSLNREVILLENVPNRTWIQIHNGNFTRQVEGCVLVGDGIKYVDKDSIPDVTNSEKVLDELLGMLPDEFDVEIKGARYV